MVLLSAGSAKPLNRSKFGVLVLPWLKTSNISARKSKLCSRQVLKLFCAEKSHCSNPRRISLFRPTGVPRVPKYGITKCTVLFSTCLQVPSETAVGPSQYPPGPVGVSMGDQKSASSPRTANEASLALGLPISG